ncbi:MAG TPA: hypothetical protein VHH73_19660 [Verrucomicrobiae bacterium]|nr:hypothetical protein [Verrucomicrobiae bacterium]
MSVTLVNNCVLIPNPPHWGSPLKWRRQWSSAVAPGVTGAEDRSSLRTKPLLRIEFTLLAATPSERALLEARLLAALRLGRAAVPFWARPTPVEPPGADINSLGMTTSGLWPWAAGDWVYFPPSPGVAEEFRQLTAASPGIMAWTDQLTASHREGTFAYPLLFGTPSVGDINAISNHLAEAPSLALQEPLGN